LGRHSTGQAQIKYLIKSKIGLASGQTQIKSVSFYNPMTINGFPSKYKNSHIEGKLFFSVFTFE
jgi:hypothetical protein